MRRPFAVVLLVAATRVFAQDANGPEATVARGVAAFRAGSAVRAIPDLEGALRVLLSADQATSYLSTGRLDSLTAVETALVYLALSQFRLGHEDDARDTLFRLLAAEKIAPTYATLSLGADAAELETLAAALIPQHRLPRNGELPPEDAARPLPPIVLKQESVRQAERQDVMNGLLGDFVRPASAPAVVAATAVTASAPAAVTASVRGHYAALREADIAAENGAIEQAVRLYARAVEPAGASREVLIAAGIGLYRTAAFREAALAFRRLGTFSRGEEDLRYYYAVSLYESGAYPEAQKEMACAFPFVVVTEEVLRYRSKIELTLASK